jgi:nucleotide-binding universal stress UspA family protein
MLKTILLPLDGSSLATRALPYAAALARRAGATIVLVEAVQSDTQPNRSLTATEIRTIAVADGSLGKVASQLRVAGVTATVHVSSENPVAAILDAAQLHRVDVIVMSTHGRSGIGQLVYGSIAADILRHADVPVLLVPATSNHAWPTDRPLTVLVPLDGSEWGEAALGALDTLPPVSPSGAELRLLRVIEPPAYPLYSDGYGSGYVYAPFNKEGERASAISYLNGVATRLTERGYTPRVEVAIGNTAATITSVARDQNADVVVMATHGRSGLAQAVLGSVATTTVQRAGVPVLLSRPAGVRSAREPRPEQVTPSADPRRTEDTSAMVLLTPGERDLVQSGLELLLADSKREEHEAAPIRAILVRIADVASDRPKALVVAAC